MMSQSAWKRASQVFSYEHFGNSYLQLIKKCQERRNIGAVQPRSGQIDVSLLGDLPRLPIIAVRPIRKILRMIGLWPAPKKESMLFDPGESQE